MPDSSKFMPDWVSPPGDTIQSILTDRGISTDELSSALQCSRNDLRNLLQGRTSISISIARKLSKFLGASVEFWISRDYQYRQDSARIYKADEGWLADLPINDMVKWKWLQPAPKPSEEMAACLRFFDVPDVAQWRVRYANVTKYASLKTSQSFDSSFGALSAWLRKGEIEANSIKCKPWNPTVLRDSIPTLRSLTKIKQPRKFLPAIHEICAASGVAVVIVRAPSGCRASGAVRFVTESKAVIQLSFRYLSDDHFWFAMFHEIGHLLLQDLTGVIIEEDRVRSDQEVEADAFAASVIIPKEHERELSKLRANARDVIRFSVRMGISPGLVVGQLQHRGVIGYEQLNHLKRRYVWE